MFYTMIDEKYKIHRQIFQINSPIKLKFLEEYLPTKNFYLQIHNYYSHSLPKMINPYPILVISQLLVQSKIQEAQTVQKVKQNHLYQTSKKQETLHLARRQERAKQTRRLTKMLQKHLHHKPCLVNRRELRRLRVLKYQHQAMNNIQKARSNREVVMQMEQYQNISQGRPDQEIDTKGNMPVII